MIVEISEDFTFKYYNSSLELHREDGPAIENSNGTKIWYKNGVRHRDDGPAIEYASGAKQWWHHGRIHREDGPAIVDTNGTEYWFLNGVRLDEYSFNKAMK